MVVTDRFLRWARPLPFLCLCLAAPSALFAQPADILQSGRRTMRAERVGPGERIALDGVLDEPAWKRASSAGEFVMQDPVLGGTPTESTDVRVVFNPDHLYIGVVCHDSEPDKVAGNTRKRDEFLSADDRFMWTIDTFLDQQTGYFFEMNPSGLMADALMSAGGTRNREWDGLWNARVVRSEVGWTIEIDIPFRTLNFDPHAPAWGINFQRTVRRKNEETLWTGYQRNQGLFRMANAGLLLGLSETTQGHGVEVKPYAAGTVADAPGRDPAVARHGSADAGVDVSYSLTPRLRAMATVNTDFAETEVDQRLVNLTRFPLFYPEKRGFFLDGATFFDFPERTFFSRRIGLDANGQPQRIDVGAKLTGQAGRQDVGAMYVRTGDDNDVVGEDFLVGRARRRVLRQSSVGGIYTVRRTRGPDAPPARQTAGVDFRLVTSTFRGRQNLEASGGLSWSSNPLGLGDNLSYGAGLSYPNDVWEAEASFYEVQRNYDPAVGFTPRRGFRQYTTVLRYSPRPAGHRWIRRFRFGGNLNFWTDPNNRPVTRELEFTAFRVELHNQDTFEVRLTPTYERLEQDFTISSGITLPAGRDYRFTRYLASLSTASKRVLSFTGSAGWGNFFSGSRRAVSVNLGVRPRPGVTLNLSAEWNDVNLAEGHFQTRLMRLVADTQFSPFMYIVNNVQYDSVSHGLGWQSRYRWIVRPGNDIFVVYTHNWIESADPSQRFLTLDRRGAAKVVYTRRF